MRLAVRVGLAFVLLAGALGAVLVSTGGLEVMVVLLLLGLLVTRELTSAYATRNLAARIGVFVFAGVLAFVYIVVERVRDILNL